MFVCFGYDVETPSNSHLYTAAQARPKKKVRIRRKSDTSTSDEEQDLQNCRSTTNGEPSIDIFSGTDHDPLDPHEQDPNERPCDELYGSGDPCEDAEAMYMEAHDMGDLYDPCAYEEAYGGGADVYGGHDDDHDDNEFGVTAAEGFCPWESHHAQDNEHDDDYDHFYAGVDEEQDQDGDMGGEFGGDFGGMGGGEEGGDDFGGGGDYGGGDYGGGGCATGDDFGGDVTLVADVGHLMTSVTEVAVDTMTMTIKITET